MIEARGLVKRYGATTAVDDLSFDVLPGTVTLYPLPDTMKVPEADHYSYGIVNDHPIVVERTTRRSRFRSPRRA